jgi:hypothetical protein
MRRTAMLAWGVILLAAGTAQAIPIKENARLFGSYARGGNCTTLPRVTMGPAGVTLIVGQKSRLFPKAEAAHNFGGPDDQTLTVLVNGTGDGLAITVFDEFKPDKISFFGAAPWTPEEKAIAAVPEMRRCRAGK